MQANIIVYSGAHCPYCVRAKQWLEQQQLDYTELKVDENPELRAEMLEKTGGRRSIPQIIINGHAIGGYDDLMQLVREEKLQALLDDH